MASLRSASLIWHLSVYTFLIWHLSGLAGFKARGLNDAGAAANCVETEQVIIASLLNYSLPMD